MKHEILTVALLGMTLSGGAMAAGSNAADVYQIDSKFQSASCEQARQMVESRDVAAMDLVGGYLAGAGFMEQPSVDCPAGITAESVASMSPATW